jgi:hypothetical protein
VRQHATLPRPETPSIDRSRPRYELSLVARLFGPPLVPPLCRGTPSFRHAFTPNVWPLDPRTYRLFTGALEPHAAYRLLQTGRSTSTLPNRPNSLACYDGEPPNERRPHPRRELPAGLSQARGSLPLLGGATPAVTTARHCGFTPTCLSRAPLVASPCPTGAGKLLRDGRAETRPRNRTNSPDALLEK